MSLSAARLGQPPSSSMGSSSPVHITNLEPTMKEKSNKEGLHAQKQAQHSALISLIVTKNQKLRKEIGIRNWRFREALSLLAETNKALESFQDESWPAVNKPDLPQWAQGGDDYSDVDDIIRLEKEEQGRANNGVNSSHNGIENGNDEDLDNKIVVETIDTRSLDTVEMSVNGTTSSQVAKLNDGEDEQEEDADDSEKKTDLNSSFTQDDVQGAEDDVSTFGLTEASTADISTILPSLAPNNLLAEMDEAMHPAIITALSCYCAILSSNGRTYKMVEIVLECISLLVSNRYVFGRAIKQEEAKPADIEEKDVTGKKEKEFTIFFLIDSICRCADSSTESNQTAMAKTLLVLMTTTTCGIHEAAMLKAVRAVFHVYLVTKHANAKNACKEVLFDMLKSVFSRMESYEAMMAQKKMDDDDDDDMSSVGGWENKAEDTEELHDPSNIFASQFHTDGYLLFRALCKLSAKTLKEDSNDGDQGVATTKIALFSTITADPLASKSKILALELILSVFEHCGPAFRNGEKFLYAVQNYLCESLLNNCMSSNTTVVELSLKIFLMLVYFFKVHLKAEVEVFLTNIFLPVLESQNSSFEQKKLVLEALRALCADPVTLTQIFLNYDCDFDAVNLYRTIVHHITTLSVKSRRGSVNTGGKSQSRVLDLSVAGLEVLVMTMRAFLKALHLPGGNDKYDSEENSAFAKMKGNQQLDIGLAVRSGEDSQSAIIGGISQLDMGVSPRNRDRLDSAADSDTGSIYGISSAEEVAEKIVDAFDRKQTAQQNLEMGSVKFSLSLKQGLRFFMDHGFFKLDAKEIALFFIEHKEKLDMTQIGEVLGKEPESSFVKDKDVEADKGGEGFFVRILHHYVDALDFSSIEFDQAIRLFLSGFRLPGEAQKIDRIMEKFAERFTRQNEDIFPSADTAFILAFSVIMLQTDLHNPSIKPEKRMTVESFIRNNRGISVDGGDLPEEFLTGIFKRIQQEPFTLKEDDDARAAQAKTSKTLSDNSAFFGSNEDRRRERFRKERAELMASSEMLFKKKGTPEKSSSSVITEFTESVCPADVVKPMFEVTWGPLIGALSQVLEMADDEGSIALALNGIVYCVRVSAHIGMNLARNTFILSLAKFTTLGSIKEMERKNIECIRTLLSIAIMDGEYIGESWQTVLQCISQLGRLQQFASGNLSENAVSLEAAKLQIPDDPNAMNHFFRTSSRIEMSRETEESNGRAVLEAINEVLIEKVFTSSVNLSPECIVHFVECLIVVSETEIDGDSKKGISGVGRRSKAETPKGKKNSSPRTFSLQRLVEVADYNMKVRPRLIWSKIWKLISSYLEKMGCHTSPTVSMFAIDALRQLSCKFLEKPELADFNFQRKFLHPFLSIMQSDQSPEATRELVLNCVDNIIRSMSHNLRSGWKIFFSILGESAKDPSEKISTFGLAILQRLLDDNLDDVVGGKSTDGDDEHSEDHANDEAKEIKKSAFNAEDFVSLCHASLSFLERESQLPIGLSMRALCHASIYADLIAAGRVLPPVSGSQTSDPTASGYTYPGLAGKDAEEMVLWRPLIDGLAKGMRSRFPSTNGGVGCVLQRGSTMTLRAILLCYAEKFSIKQWDALLDQAVLPAIQKAAENDSSPVTSIVSESPFVSNLDFLSDSLPLPPSHDDEDLQKFATASQSDECAPSRPMGRSELIVEASFADLRHGGNGNLKDAHNLLKKATLSESKNIEEPFPDSWIATTAPIALGMLIDFFSEAIISHGADGREIIWPKIIVQMQLWSIGYSAVNGTRQPDEENKDWAPCEALVRIGCKGMSRLSQILIDALPSLNDTERKTWVNTLCLNVADTMSKNLEVEMEIDTAVNGKALPDQSYSDNKPESIEKKQISTPYGMGEICRERYDKYVDNDGSEHNVRIEVVKLDSGATLYGPAIGVTKETTTNQPLSIETNTNDKNDKRENILSDFVKPLKLRCIASYCLQRILPITVEAFSAEAGKEEVTCLLNALEKSRVFALKCNQDKDLSNSFKKAMVLEWGEEIEKEAALSPGGENHRGSSEMFFLTQEAVANKVIILFLSVLFRTRESDESNTWDTISYSEPLLLERMIDVLQKFIVSERADAHRLDPNVWRISNDSGGKVAVYCTKFAAVVVHILETIIGFDRQQFEGQKSKLFPILCSLITVQSEEIRKLVAQVFREKVGSLLHLSE